MAKIYPLFPYGPPHCDACALENVPTITQRIVPSAAVGKYAKIQDFHHASEHLDAVTKAVHGRDSCEAPVLWEHPRGLLYEGHVAKVITEITAEPRRLGPPEQGDGPEHPRRVLQQNQGYFEKHQEHMRYDVYGKKGWPIGSGNTEAGVKAFSKRVKGTDQFWNSKVRNASWRCGPCG